MLDSSEVLREITPLSERDCFYIAERYKQEFTYPMHSHQEFELNFVERGKGVKRIVGDSVATLGDFDLVLITGRDLAHEWRTFENHKRQIREITIQFSPDLFDDNLLNKTQFGSIKKMMESAQVGLAFSLRSIMKVYSMLDTLSSQKGFYAVMQFISILYELSLADDSQPLSSSSYAHIVETHSSRRIKKICDYINQNYSGQIRLQEIASLVGMTPVALSRFFSHKTGRSLSDYIIDIKLGHTTRLLVNSTHTVSEICYECGFNNISNFNRIFKRKRGCSPKEFRENYGKKKSII